MLNVNGAPESLTYQLMFSSFPATHRNINPFFFKNLSVCLVQSVVSHIERTVNSDISPTIAQTGF